MLCAHCGKPLSYLRFFTRPRFDSGAQCASCGKVSYVATGERLKRGYILNVLGSLSIPLTADFLKPSLGPWSIIVGVAVGLPILCVTTYFGMRRCHTVPSLPHDVLERRANFTKLMLAVFAIIIPLSILALFEIVNESLAMVIVIPIFLLFLMAGWATVFTNIKDGG